MIKAIIVVNFLFTLSCFSQANRKAFTLEIAANETQQYVADIADSPYFVKEKLLQIYCGEKVFVECEIAGDSISTMKVVERNLHPNRTIEIEFNQESKDRKSINTMLHLNNPFDKDLFYDAIMLTPKSPQWKSTSTIPIRTKLGSYETWGHAIISLGLMNWRFKKD